MKLRSGYIKFAKKYLGFIPEKTRLQWYPPWWMMRIKVVALDNGWRTICIKLPLSWIARNMGGSMFGGFQASLADPIAPLACAKVFDGYDVWTRKLSLDFRFPGSTDLELRFDFPKEKEQQIRKELEERGRSTPSFDYGYYLADGKMCTKVTCVVAIRPSYYRKEEK